MRGGEEPAEKKVSGSEDDDDDEPGSVDIVVDEIVEDILGEKNSTERLEEY